MSLENQIQILGILILELNCLKAAGQEDRDFLQSVSFDIGQGSYKEELTLLDDHDGRKENFWDNTKILFCVPNYW